MASGDDGKRAGEVQLTPPVSRRLRVYTFDPSLSTQMQNRHLQHATVDIPWEDDLEPGPKGEYLEVIDIDPASQCAYRPVNLNDPYLLAQDGLEPSMGNPQFHQQMVYAVAMKTIKSFELALGRPIFWSPVRPWKKDDEAEQEIVDSMKKWQEREDKEREANGEEKAYALRDRYVKHLRIYPHALREQNAYYSPTKRALLFGYFNATESSPGEVYPGGIVFTCLSQDIVAHETTHAIVDGMHNEFNQATNPDVFAFHEAMADIVALFQHFTYPEVLRDQIMRTRGNLNTENLLMQLAQEFGRATGGHHALRDAIGGKVVVTNEGVQANKEGKLEQTVEVMKLGPGGVKVKTEETREVFKRYEPDPDLLSQGNYTAEAHKRGSILVAAVFDAFLAIYSHRVADLVRIATGGSGKLPDGNLQYDLVNRLADEARKTAQHLLRMCIRGLDYTPPIDITFGEYLRAVVTADYDVYPVDPRGYRTAIIEAFRKWGIYPRDVRVLAEESLIWHRMEGLGSLITPERLIALVELLKKHPTTKLRIEARENPELTDDDRIANIREQFRQLKLGLEHWKPGARREDIFDLVLDCQSTLHNYIYALLEEAKAVKKANEESKSEAAPHEFSDLCAALYKIFYIDDKVIKDATKFQKVSVDKLRPARRIAPDGSFKQEMVFEATTRLNVIPNPARSKDPDAPEFTATKELDEDTGFKFLAGATFVVDMDTWEIRYCIYKRLGSESRLQRNNAFSSYLRMAGEGGAEQRCGGYEGDVYNDRRTNIEAMRADHCKCKDRKEIAVAKNKKMKEPFAFLHKGVRDESQEGMEQ